MSDDPTQPVDYEVFISYRIDRDQTLADSLQALLRKTIDPAPRVFVAGLGGIRPSAQGSGLQLQRAAQSASVFIAILTHASKGREWINFEAGAAWGRGQTYVPLMIGTSVEDLPSTITGYQSYSARDKARVKDLVQIVASETGKAFKHEPRSTFGTYYYQFSRVITQYLEPPSQDRDQDPDEDALRRAIRLVGEGDQGSADALFEQLEGEAREGGDVERECEVRIERIFATTSQVNEQLRQLEGLGEALMDTATFELRHARATRHHRQAIKLYRRCLERDLDDETRASATLGLAGRLVAAGQRAEGRGVLEEALRASDPQLVTLAAGELAALLNQDMAKLLVLLRGLGRESPRIFKALAELARTSKWRDMQCYFAREHQRVANDGSAILRLGGAQVDSELPSLAYLSFRRAAEAGVSVARSNIGGLFLNGAVPAAGLQMLEEHTERFDAATPGVPYTVRSQIEDRIHQEQRTFKEAVERGQRCYGALSTFIDGVLDDALDQPIAGKWLFESGDLRVAMTLTEPDLECDAERFTAHSLELFEAVFVINDEAKPCALLSFSTDPPCGVAFGLTDQPSSIEWGELTRASDPEPSVS